MKIAVLGTKGIPNNYGGFEQFAEYLSRGLVKLGHEVTVYNPHYHPYAGDYFEGAKIKRVYSPEKSLGGAANFLYDFLCLKDALKDDYDLIYEAGYHSVAISYLILGVKSIKRPLILTNMDGLEWKRSKWNTLTKKLIKVLEKIAVRNSHFLISDNVGIQSYYKSRFGCESFFLPYGADLIESFNEQHVHAYQLIPFSYHLVVARLEPENNIEIILDGYIRSGTSLPICIVGNTQHRYGQYLMRKYKNPNIRFLGPIYIKPVLDSMRHFSQIYFHGHSVGGTNPSLLEAMASKCFICAHDNPFNKSILQDGALYFHGPEDIKSFLENNSLRESSFNCFEPANTAKIRNIYNWDLVIRQHDALFTKLVVNSGR